MDNWAQIVLIVCVTLLTGVMLYLGWHFVDVQKDSELLDSNAVTALVIGVCLIAGGLLVVLAVSISAQQAKKSKSPPARSVLEVELASLKEQVAQLRKPPRQNLPDYKLLDKIKGLIEASRVDQIMEFDEKGVPKKRIQKRLDKKYQKEIAVLLRKVLPVPNQEQSSNSASTEPNSPEKSTA